MEARGCSPCSLRVLRVSVVKSGLETQPYALGGASRSGSVSPRIRSSTVSRARTTW